MAGDSTTKPDCQLYEARGPNGERWAFQAAEEGADRAGAWGGNERPFGLRQG
jgi:hypothetical protein